MFDTAPPNSYVFIGIAVVLILLVVWYCCCTTVQPNKSRQGYTTIPPAEYMYTDLPGYWPDALPPTTYTISRLYYGINRGGICPGNTAVQGFYDQNGVVKNQPIKPAGKIYDFWTVDYDGSIWRLGEFETGNMYRPYLYIWTYVCSTNDFKNGFTLYDPSNDAPVAYRDPRSGSLQCCNSTIDYFSGGDFTLNISQIEKPFDPSQVKIDFVYE